IICINKYPTSVCVFPDPILFLVGLQPSWEHGQQRPAIMVDGKGTSFMLRMRKICLFLPNEPSSGLSTGSPSVSVNTKPPSVDAKPALKLAKDTTDSGGSLKPEVFVVHPGSMAARIKDRKCKTRGGSSRPPMKIKLTYGSLSSRATRAKASSSKDDTPFIMVSNDDEAWKNHLDNHMDVELLDLHDRYYARQDFLDNSVNMRSRELLQVIKKIRGKCDVMKERERAREEECEELRSKCKAAMTDFEKNLTGWAGYQVSHSALELKVASLEAEKVRLEATEASLKKEFDDVKRDRMEVVLKVSSFEQVADMKEPFNLSKVKGYFPSYKKEHTQAGNDLATATFPWLSEFVSDPSKPIEVLLSKKPSTLQRHVPSKTQVPVPSSQRATPSLAPTSNIMFPHAAVSSVKPQSSQGQ
ncbi:hypothetical protein Tco_1100479, partial [Tanacetum coccineum]